MSSLHGKHINHFIAVWAVMQSNAAVQSFMHGMMASRLVAKSLVWTVKTWGPLKLQGLLLARPAGCCWPWLSALRFGAFPLPDTSLGELAPAQLQAQIAAHHECAALICLDSTAKLGHAAKRRSQALPARQQPMWQASLAQPGFQILTQAANLPSCPSTG